MAWSFCVESERLLGAFPALQAWLLDNPAQLEKQAGHWPELIAVCRHLCAHPRPDCYLRQLDIPGVDTKFIEQHRSILKSLLDQLLPEQAIDQSVTGLGDHGFERRFGLRYEEPQIRLRLLDSQLAAEFAGACDITLTVRDFAKLDLLVDRVFITENKINGLTFPGVRNGLVIRPGLWRATAQGGALVGNLPDLLLGRYRQPWLCHALATAQLFPAHPLSTDG